MQKRLWRRATLSIGTPLGYLEGGSFTKDIERRMKRALGVKRLSLRKLCEGNLEVGGIF
jgi:hypothetical protein